MIPETELGGRNHNLAGMRLRSQRIAPLLGPGAGLKINSLLLPELTSVRDFWRLNTIDLDPVMVIRLGACLLVANSVM